MRFLIDECLRESLVGVAHAGGFEAIHDAAPALQRALFQAVIQYLEARDLVNSVVEVTLKGKTVQCVQYSLPGGKLDDKS